MSIINFIIALSVNEAFLSVSTIPRPSAQRLKPVSNPDLWEYNPEELLPLRRFSSTVVGSPGSRIWLRGGGRFNWRGGTLTMNACEARGRYEKRGGGGGGGVLSVLGPIQKRGGGAVRYRPDTKSGGGGVQSALGPIRKVGGGGGGGGGGNCLPYDDLYLGLCARA